MDALKTKTAWDIFLAYDREAGLNSTVDWVISTISSGVHGLEVLHVAKLFGVRIDKVTYAVLRYGVLECENVLRRKVVHMIGNNTHTFHGITGKWLPKHIMRNGLGTGWFTSASMDAKITNMNDIYVLANDEAFVSREILNKMRADPDKCWLNLVVHLFSGLHKDMGLKNPWPKLFLQQTKHFHKGVFMSQGVYARARIPIVFAAKDRYNMRQVKKAITLTDVHIIPKRHLVRHAAFTVELLYVAPEIKYNKMTYTLRVALGASSDLGDPLPNGNTVFDHILGKVLVPNIFKNGLREARVGTWRCPIVEDGEVCGKTKKQCTMYTNKDWSTNAYCWRHVNYCSKPFWVNMLADCKDGWDYLLREDDKETKRVMMSDPDLVCEDVVIRFG